MMQDVQMCRQLNCKGIVTGLLKNDGSVDINRTQLLVQAAGPMEVTFHRAFHQARNPQQALEDIIATGCTRLLTSGQKQTAFDGKQLIKDLMMQAANRIIIMPGGGVRSNNISDIAEYTNATEFHSSARIQVPSGMDYILQGIKEDLAVPGVETAEIIKMKTALIGVFRK